VVVSDLEFGWFQIKTVWWSEVNSTNYEACQSIIFCPAVLFRGTTTFHRLYPQTTLNGNFHVLETSKFFQFPLNKPVKNVLWRLWDFTQVTETSGNSQPDSITPHLSTCSYLIYDWGLNSSVHLEKQYSYITVPFFIHVHKNYYLCSKFQSCFC
jgi:hypothetical protein